MAERNPISDQDSGAMSIPSSGGSRSIQPFGLDLGVRRKRDEEYYSERMGSIAFHKILTPKSGTFEVLIRTVDDSQEEVQICEPYDTAAADLDTRHTKQILKNTFQKTLELISEDEMYSSSVIGWTAESGQVCLINKTHLGRTAEDIVPLTDTIFPVFVMGREELPVELLSFDRDIMEYETGLYLVLGDYPGLGSFTVEIEVNRGPTPSIFNVHTYRSELELYSLHLLWDNRDMLYVKIYKNLGKIDRILDKDNTAYGVYGMYGGGPLPPKDSRSSRKLRITWDQPRSMSADDYGLSSMEAGFRIDVDYQKLGRRTGFYCSKDALLAVLETTSLAEPIEAKPQTEEYRSLLKEYTYAVIDGFCSYAMFHSESDTQYIPFKDLDNYPLGPILVIVPEGISSLRLIEHRENALHRNGRYYNENSMIPPMLINWRVFQNHFNRSGTTQALPAAPQVPVSTGIQQIMHLRDINDYVVFPIDSLRRVYVFSIKQEPNYFPNQNRFDDYWNIYGKVSDQRVDENSALYYYLGTISNSFMPRFGTFQYGKTFFHRSLFPAAISSKYSSIPLNAQERQRAGEMANEFRSVMQNQDFKTLTRHLITVDANQINNPSIYCQSRQQKIDALKNRQFVGQPLNQ